MKNSKILIIFLLFLLIYKFEMQSYAGNFDRDSENFNFEAANVFSSGAYKNRFVAAEYNRPVNLIKKFPLSASIALNYRKFNEKLYSNNSVFSINKLYGINFSLNHTDENYNADLSINSYSNKPFHSFDETKIALLYSHCIKTYKNGGKFYIGGILSNDRKYPFMPGITYLYFSPDFFIMLPLPFKLNCKLSDKYSISTEYMLLRDLNISVNYAASNDFIISAFLNCYEKGADIAERADKNTILFNREKKTGVIFSKLLNDKIKALITTGYQFDACYFMGEFNKDKFNLIKPADSFYMNFAVNITIK